MSVPVTSCHCPPALVSEAVSSSLSVPSGPVWGKTVTPDPRPGALELDTLYKQMNEQDRGEGQGGTELSEPCSST